MTNQIDTSRWNFTIVYNNYTGVQTRAIIRIEDISDGVKFSDYEDAISWVVGEAYDNGAFPISEFIVIPYHRILGFELNPEFTKKHLQPQVSPTQPQQPQQIKNKKRGRYYRHRHHGIQNGQNGGNNSNNIAQNVDKKPNNVTPNATPQDVISLTPKNGDSYEKKDYVESEYKRGGPL